VVDLKGLEKFAPKDFPGFLSATVFLPGCNFRCPYCHNAELVLHPDRLASIPLDFFLAFLDSRKGWLEGICVSGGEPLLEPDLESFLAVIKERAFLVKLDTNGSLPGRLEAVVRAGLADHVAMDIKAPAARYAEVVRAAVDPGDIERSVRFLRESGVPHVLRTTVVPGLVGPEDLSAIGTWIGGASVFQIQNFSPAGVADAGLAARRPYPPDAVSAMADAMALYFDTVRIEGA